MKLHRPLPLFKPLRACVPDFLRFSLPLFFNPSRRKSSRAGSALLTAMLAVALIATLSSMALWQLWQLVSVQTLQQHSRQNHWLLLGAMDWGRIILREDAKAGTVDHLGEPWAMPLQPLSLGRFVQSLDKAKPGDVPIAAQDDIWLSGRMLDAQSRFNLHDLATGQDEASKIWRRLFLHLNLPLAQAEQVLVAWKQARTQAPNASLMPQRLRQLSWFGLPPETLQRLAPHVGFLPVPAPMNLNTATPEVLAAASGLPLALTRRWALLRQTQPATTLEDAARKMGVAAADLPSSLFSVQTQWIEIQGQLWRVEEALSPGQAEGKKIGLEAIALVRRQQLSHRLVQLQFQPAPDLASSSATALANRSPFHSFSTMP